MIEPFISLKTAKLAKEKNFNIPCVSFYIDGIFMICDSNIKPINEEIEYIDPFYFIENWNSGSEVYPKELLEDPSHEPIIYSAPQQSLLQGWLRLNNIHIEIGVLQRPKNPDKFSVKIFGKDFFRDGFLTYEEALETGLLEGLKFII